MKLDLKAFIKRLARHYASYEGYEWKGELQERGTWHYHLIVWFSKQPDIRTLRLWVASNWTAIAEPGDLQHFMAGTQVVRARNTSGRGLVRLLHYLSKYMGKSFRATDPVTGELLHTGRVWGFAGKVPFGLNAYRDLSEHESYQLIRRVRRFGSRSRYLSGLGKRHGGDLTGFLVMGDGRLVGQLLRGLGTEEASDDG